MLRHLRQYAVQLSKEAALQVLIVVDLLGIVALYVAEWSVPQWTGLVLPFIGLFLASFNIYRRSPAEIRLLPADSDGFPFALASGPQRTEMFKGIVVVHLANLSSQPGAVQNVEITWIGLNGHTDAFLVRKIGLDVSVSPVYAGVVVDADFPERAGGRLPPTVSLPSKSNQPVSVVLDICFQGQQYRTQEHIEDALDWLESVDLCARFRVTDALGSRKEEMLLKVPAARIRKAAKVSQIRYMDERPEARRKAS